MSNAFSSGRRVWWFAVFIVAAPLVQAEENVATRFAKAAKTGTPDQAEKILAEWGKKEPDNPDYYIAGANYYFGKWNRGGVMISTKPATAGEPVISDLGGKAVGSISATQDPKLIDQAIKLLALGCERFPQRMDIWFGRVQLYEAAQMDAELLGMLKQIAAHVAAHPSGLQIRGGRPFAEPVGENVAMEFSGFARNAYQRETKAGDELFRAIAELTAEAYPMAVYGHNLLGTYYSAIQTDHPRAIESYRKALAIAPSDSLVWCNLGESYRQAEKLTEAREAFEKVLELNNDPESVAMAKKQIAALAPK